MSDLPEQYTLQQQYARPVSGEELETFGKKASADWRAGNYDTLTSAVVGTVKHSQLSPEQVRRVVEFTNQDAYLVEFRKEGKHKVVHFDCGPADPSEVLKDLNDGGGGTVFDRGTLDYGAPPKMASARSSMEKVASASEEEFNPYEDMLLQSFAVTPEKVASHDPSRPARDLWYEFSSASQQLTSDIDSLEIDFHDAGERLYGEIKQAALEGVTLGEIVISWADIAPNPDFIKAAFSMMGPRLKADLGSLDAVGASLQKTGSAHVAVNYEHPVVVTFKDFCMTLNKLAGMRELKADVDYGLVQSEALMKEAASAGGYLSKGWKTLGDIGGKAGDAAGGVSKLLVDEKTLNPKTVKNVVQKGVQYGGAGGALLAANAAQQEVTDRPVVRSGLNAAKSVVPGTQEYNMRRARIMSGGMY